MVQPPKIHVFTDFDGTVTVQDTLQMILDRFAGADWREIEERVRRGDLPESESLQMEFDLVSATRGEAVRFLLQRDLVDPYFPRFARWAKEEDIPLTILSGGFRGFIRTLLKRAGLEELEVRANGVEVRGRRWRVIPRGGKTLCGKCNHCKSVSIEEARERAERVIFIGDGVTDRCPAPRADVLFAKGFLKRWCRREGVPFLEYEHFGDIMNALRKMR